MWQIIKFKFKLNSNSLHGVTAWRHYTTSLHDYMTSLHEVAYFASLLFDEASLGQWYTSLQWDQLFWETIDDGCTKTKMNKDLPIRCHLPKQKGHPRLKSKENTKMAITIRCHCSSSAQLHLNKIKITLKLKLK